MEAILQVGQDSISKRAGKSSLASRIRWSGNVSDYAMQYGDNFVRKDPVSGIHIFYSVRFCTYILFMLYIFLDVIGAHTRYAGSGVCV